MTRVLAVIGARLNSSRLPRKHLLDLAGKPLIARIFERLDAVPEIDISVLATTADNYNRPLTDWAKNAGRNVAAWPGDVNDLTGRVDHVVRLHEPDIVVYVCGDSPLIEPGTLSKLIQALKANPKADTACVAHNPGRPIHEGFDVYTADYWRRIEAASTESFHREHVGSARNLCNPITTQVVDEAVFYQLEHRLSVDTPSDYRFMQQIYLDWYRHHPAAGLVSLPHVIQRLQHEPELCAINAAVHQKGLLERSVPTDVVAAIQADGSVSVPVHDLVNTLQDSKSAGVTLHLVGAPSEATQADPRLKLLPHHWYPHVGAALDAASGEQLHVHTNGMILDEALQNRLNQMNAILTAS